MRTIRMTVSKTPKHPASYRCRKDIKLAKQNSDGRTAKVMENTTSNKVPMVTRQARVLNLPRKGNMLGLVIRIVNSSPNNI